MDRQTPSHPKKTCRQTAMSRESKRQRGSGKNPHEKTKIHRERGRDVTQDARVVTQSEAKTGSQDRKGDTERDRQGMGRNEGKRELGIGHSWSGG